MIFNPIKGIVIGASALTISVGGLVSSGIVRGERNNESSFYKISTRECNIYVVGRPIKDNEGRLKISKMKRHKERNNKEFFEDRQQNKDLEEKVTKGCQNGFTNAYIYQDLYYHWIYDENLQKHNWLEDGNVTKVDRIDQL